MLQYSSNLMTGVWMCRTILSCAYWLAEICQSRCVLNTEWVSLSLIANFRRKGHHPSTTVSVRKLEWMPFRAVAKYSQCIVWFCHKARVRQTDGRTDRQRDKITTPETALATASRGKNGGQNGGVIVLIVKRNSQSIFCFIRRFIIIFKQLI